MATLFNISFLNILNMQHFDLGSHGTRENRFNGLLEGEAAGDTRWMESARHVRAVLIVRQAGRTSTVLASHLHWDRALNGLTLDNFKGTTKVSGSVKRRLLFHQHPTLPGRARLQSILESDGWHGFLESDQSSIQLNQQDHAFVMFVDHFSHVFVVVVTGGYPTRYIIAADGSGMIDGAFLVCLYFECSF